ncbi:MAG TPA: DUF4398 domain-containing protein, partial [Burkholderiales bacterium]|nr:DUF4398 domain-containing protein [Burkholderiales bacterium]
MSNPIKLTVIAAALAAGCTTVAPVANQRLEEARATYQRAAGDPLVQRHAQAELQQAANALADAERRAADGQYWELVEHNAYIADRRARTALAAAQARQADIDLAAAHEERWRSLQAEAAAARIRAEQAESARQQAEARAAQLADAKAKQDRETAAAEELAAEVRRLESAGVRARQSERGWVLT